MNEEKGLNFGFIGLGQCGCNIANEAAALKYTAIAINTSGTDLALLSNIPKANRLLINVGVEGAGKNPDIGRAALEEKIEDVYSLISTVFNKDINYDKIFICVGLGGGTGTGTVTLLSQILLDEGYKVAVISTLSSKTDSPRAQLITLSAYEEISQISGLSIFYIDNQKSFELNSKAGIKTKYSIINKKITSQLDTINKITKKPSYMAFDSKDLDTVLDMPGMALISQIDIDNLEDLREPSKYLDLINKSMEDSLSPNIIGDVNATAAAILFEVPKKYISLINENAMSIIQEKIGNPFDIFYGIYETDNKQASTGKLTILLTGISAEENQRINDISTMMDKNQNKYEKMFAAKSQVSSTKGKDLLKKFSHDNIVKSKANGINPKQNQEESKVSMLDKLRNKNKK